MDNREVKRMFATIIAQSNSYSPQEDEDFIEYRSSSRYHTQTASNDGGKSTTRVTMNETTKTHSFQGDTDIFRSKHVSVTTPDNMSGEELIVTENNRTQTLRKLKSSFLSKGHPAEESKTDPFAKFGIRPPTSLTDASGSQEESHIEIHKFPFAEPFSTPNSIRKEKVTYSTQVKTTKCNGQTKVVKTTTQGEGDSCSVQIEEITTCEEECPNKVNELTD